MQKQNTTNTHTREVVITYWPWMKVVGLLEEVRLEKLPWAEARHAWLTDPQPYEYVVARAPAMLKLPSGEIAPPARALSTPTSIKYDQTPAPLDHWPWERMMWMREQVRLSRGNVSWAEARRAWLTELEAYGCTLLQQPDHETTPSGKSYAAQLKEGIQKPTIEPFPAPDRKSTASSESTLR